MTIAYDELMACRVPEVIQTLTADDCILYAISVGFGHNPMDERQLRYVYEDGLRVVPTMANVVASTGFWLLDNAIGVDWKRVLHGEQAMTLYRPLPLATPLIGRTRIVGINDKGVRKGAVMYVRREVREHTNGDQERGDPVCRLEQTLMLRGDGGCGGNDPPPLQLHEVPQRKADEHCDRQVPSNAALLYRLNGDRNPLHIDPNIAKMAGFSAPILHGLCTMAYAGHALLRHCCDYDAARLRTLQVRFSAPVFPGETLRTELWVDSRVISFRTKVLERDVIVINNGKADLVD